MAEPEVTPEAAPAPQPLQLARVLWIASTVVSMARALTKLSDREAIMNQLQAMRPDLPFDQVDSAASASVFMGLAMSLGFVAIYAWLSSRMLAGFPWARMVLVAFGVIGVSLNVLGLVGLAGGVTATAGLQVTTLDVVFGTTVLALDATALVLMFRRESLAYFAKMAPLRMPRRPSL
ncbi:hypothetical protein GCM10022247_22640 [Allokutzneria multivorans]|uniref:DUF2127 domain-containing protein n=1 Tax=Allokutzneria multivorans TaxID=1142134 RepID=A0ABP7RS32_9PSEU